MQRQCSRAQGETIQEKKVLLFYSRTGLPASCSHTRTLPCPEPVHTAQPVFPDYRFPNTQDKRHSLVYLPLYISWCFRVVVMFGFFMYPLLGVFNDYSLSSLLRLRFILSHLSILLTALRLQSYSVLLFLCSPLFSRTEKLHVDLAQL